MRIYQYSMIVCVILLFGCMAKRGDLLVQAAFDGEVSVVDYSLHHGVDVNYQEPRFGMTALSAASMRGNLQIVKTLLKYGADVNLAQNNGTTPLMSAVISGRRDVVDLLLASGANPCAIDNIYGLTALQLVPIHCKDTTESVAIIQSLVTAGTPVDHRSKIGETAFYCALYKDRASLAKALWDAGANPNIAGRYGTAHEVALRKGNHEIVKMLSSSSLSSATTHNP